MIKIKENDIIKCYLDLNTYNIGYYINGKYLGELIKNIKPNIKYQFAIALVDKSDTIKII